MPTNLTQHYHTLYTESLQKFQADLQQSIDKRYAIQTAHSTIVRLRKPLLNKAAWLECVEAYRDFDFGTFEVQVLELVFNDWYHQKEKVKDIGLH